MVATTGCPKCGGSGFVVNFTSRQECPFGCVPPRAILPDPSSEYSGGWIAEKILKQDAKPEPKSNPKPEPEADPEPQKVVWEKPDAQTVVGIDHAGTADTTAVAVFTITNSGGVTLVDTTAAEGSVTLSEDGKTLTFVNKMDTGAAPIGGMSATLTSNATWVNQLGAGNTAAGGDITITGAAAGGTAEGGITLFGGSGLTVGSGSLTISALPDAHVGQAVSFIKETQHEVGNIPIVAPIVAYSMAQAFGHIEGSARRVEKIYCHPLDYADFRIMPEVDPVHSDAGVSGKLWGAEIYSHHEVPQGTVIVLSESQNCQPKFCLLSVCRGA